VAGLGGALVLFAGSSVVALIRDTRQAIVAANRPRQPWEE
jgi:hypothetical protein